LRRESGLNDTWREYYTSLVDPEERLGERAFRDILKALTATQLKARTGVNYVEAGLVHDPLTKLARIAKKACPSWDRKRMLACIKYFLKVEYPNNHVLKDKRGSHCEVHGLFEDTCTTWTCKRCQFPFRILDDLKAATAQESYHRPTWQQQRKVVESCWYKNV